MISKDEILERAHILSLEPSVVEKDYVLGWLLHAIGSHAELAEQWVFKGGTSRKQVQGGPTARSPVSHSGEARVHSRAARGDTTGDAANR